MILIKLFVIGCLLLAYAWGTAFVFFSTVEFLEGIFKKSFAKELVIPVYVIFSIASVVQMIVWTEVYKEFFISLWNII